jgi:hypothetical protein
MVDPLPFWFEGLWVIPKVTVMVKSPYINLYIHTGRNLHFTIHTVNGSFTSDNPETINDS